MKTEKFEDQIRKKLESIEPEFTENDWVNFSEYSTAKMATSAKIFSSTIFKMAASVAILGTLFISLAQYKINNDLKEKVQSLAAQNEQLLNNQKQLEKIISNENQISQNTLNTDKVDEKTNTEKINSTSTNAPNDPSNSSEIAENRFIENGYPATKEQNLVNKERLLKNVNEKYATNAASKNAENIADFKTEETENEINNIASNYKNSRSKNNHLANNYQKINDKNRSQNQKNGSNLANEKGNFDEIAGDYTVNNNAKKEINSLNFNYLASKGLKIDSSRKLKKAFNRNDFAYYKINTEKKKMYFTLADAHVRTGLTTGASRGTLSYGINAELFLDQRISLSTGVYEMQHLSEAYITTVKYNNAKHFDFNEKYKNKLPPTQEVLNIKEKTELLVLPVHLNYSHPVSDGLRLVASLGTELDLKGNTTINFNYRERTLFPGPFQNPQGGKMGDYESGSIYSSVEKKVFNNVYLGIGAEKQIGKFAFQAKAFDNFLVKDVNYRKNNRLGAELSVFYRL